MRSGEWVFYLLAGLYVRYQLFEICFCADLETLAKALTGFVYAV
jgi:hypothetical protein